MSTLRPILRSLTACLSEETERLYRTHYIFYHAMLFLILPGDITTLQLYLLYSTVL